MNTRYVAAFVLFCFVLPFKFFIYHSTPSMLAELVLWKNDLLNSLQLFSMPRNMSVIKIKFKKEERRGGRGLSEICCNPLCSLSKDIISSQKGDSVLPNFSGQENVYCYLS